MTHQERSAIASRYKAMKFLARMSIFILLIFVVGGILSCKPDPETKLVDDSFSALAKYDAVALGNTLGLGGSTPEIEALLVEVKKTFGDIKPKTLFDENKQFLGGYSLGTITLAPGNSDRGSGRPFIGSTGREGVMVFDFIGASSSPRSFSITVKIEEIRPSP